MQLLLLLALAPHVAQALSRTRFLVREETVSASDRRAPYLTTIGAPPLRFEELAPPLDLVRQPTTSPMVTPGSAATTEPAESARTTATTSAAPGADVSVIAGTKPAPKEETPAKAIPAILPDDLRPVVRPEDFIPYFQIPGSSKLQPGDVNVIMPAPRAAPAPAPLPPSSATYTQSPK